MFLYDDNKSSDEGKRADSWNMMSIIHTLDSDSVQYNINVTCGRYFHLQFTWNSDQSESCLFQAQVCCIEWWHVLAVITYVLTLEQNMLKLFSWFYMLINTLNCCSSAILVISLIILILIFQSSHLLQQTGFATIPNTWDFIWKVTVSCWGNQHIWHRVKYKASTKGLNVNVAMVASGTKIREGQCSRVVRSILQNIECKSVISE